jgi:REP-associated tyrosine transposase
VTTSTWNRRAFFHVDELAKLLVETIHKYREEGKYLLHELVIMPDHVHALITPTGITLERAMQLMKGGYSYATRYVKRDERRLRYGKKVSLITA